MVSVLHFTKKKKKYSGCPGLTSYFLKVRDSPKILNEVCVGGRGCWGGGGMVWWGAEGEKEVIQVWASGSFCPHGTHIWEPASAMTSTLTVISRNIWVQDAHTILTESALELEKPQRVLRGIKTKPNSLTWHPFPSAEDATQCFCQL